MKYTIDKRNNSSEKHFLGEMFYSRASLFSDNVLSLRV